MYTVHLVIIWFTAHHTKLAIGEYTLKLIATWWASNVYSRTGPHRAEKQSHLVTPPSIWTQNSCDIDSAGIHSVNCDASASGCPPLYDTTSIKHVTS